VSGLAARPEWAAVDEPSGFELPTFSAYPKEYVTAVGEYLLTLPQQLEVLAGGPDDAAEDVTFFAASWLTKVSPSPSLPLCLPHCGSHCVSLTFSPTVSPSLWLSLCLPHLLSHCVSPTVALTVSPSPSLPLCLPHCGSHCVSLTFSPTVSLPLWLSLCLPHTRWRWARRSCTWRSCCACPRSRTRARSRCVDVNSTKSRNPLINSISAGVLLLTCFHRTAETRVVK
jgi:hypothetical protein